MAAGGHVPQRRCIACGRTAPKRDLMRLAVAGGRVVSDPGARLPGRGAYVCDAHCAAEAVRRKALPRAFRRPVEVAQDFVELMN